MGSPIKRKLASGIYQLENGKLRAKVSCGGRRFGRSVTRDRTFPAGTGIRDLKRWQEQERNRLRQLTPRPVSGTLADDVDLYNDTFGKALRFPNHRKSELNNWLGPFGHRLRHTIKPMEIERQVSEWSQDKVAESTIRHRLSALSSLYRRLDGKGAPNPVRDVSRPIEPKPFNDPPLLAEITKVLQALQLSVRRHNRGHKTLARAYCLTYTGMRPSQLGRLDVSKDVHLNRDKPFVWIRNPGKGGEPHAVPLSSEAVQAFESFIKAGAAGPFSTSAFHKSWMKACDKAGVRRFYPYQLRHAFATRLHDHVDLADVQELLGHTSSKTTQRYAKLRNLGRLHEAVTKANRQ